MPKSKKEEAILLIRNQINLLEIRNRVFIPELFNVAIWKVETLLILKRFLDEESPIIELFKNTPIKTTSPYYNKEILYVLEFTIKSIEEYGILEKKQDNKSVSIAFDPDQSLASLSERLNPLNSSNNLKKTSKSVLLRNIYKLTDHALISTFIIFIFGILISSICGLWDKLIFMIFGTP